MTKEKATAEMKYRLSKYILQVLLDEKLITPEEAIQAKAEYEKLRKTMEQRQLKADIISGFMFAVSELDDLPIEFNEKLWTSVIDIVTVYEDESKFKNGAEIEEQL